MSRILEDTMTEGSNDLLTLKQILTANENACATYIPDTTPLIPKTQPNLESVPFSRFIGDSTMEGT